MYIVIEGQDGTGKSTQVRLLKEYFEKQGKKVVMIEEPDGDLPQAHEFHDIILTKSYNLEPLTNVLLFTASRVELWRKIMEPALKNGDIVVAARNYWSTLAYQGYGEGVSRKRIIQLTNESLPSRYCKPDFGIILVTTDEVRIKRQIERGQAIETFEAKPSEFQRRVNDAYPKIAKDFNIPTIDASGTIDEVFEKITNSLPKAMALLRNSSLSLDG